ncbi:MAG: hypothetical protein ACWGNO_07720 [Desulfobacterales bacterium]
MRLNIRIISLILAGLLFSACATAPRYRAHPQLNSKIEKVKTITVIPLKVDVYQVTAGGVKEKMDEWCTQAKRNVLTAIEDELKLRPLLNIKSFPEILMSEDRKINLEQTGALFEAVNSSIIIHTYGQPVHRFPEKIQNFDYTLGPEVRQLSGQTDALLFVRGVDNIATAGRKAVQAGSVILGALVGVQVAPNMGVTAVNLALVDSNTGEVLWFNFHASAGDHDLRNPVDTTALVMDILKDFPIKKPVK